MLKDPRAVKCSRRFAVEWLDLDRLANLRPHQAKYPHWNADLATDMRRETLAFFEEIVWTQKRPLSELLNAARDVRDSAPGQALWPATGESADG